MNPALGPAEKRRMMEMGPEELREFLRKCGPSGVLWLDAAFEMWASEGQLPPPGEGWRVWLMMAGRGFGKTRAGAEWVNNLARSGPKRIALVGASIDEARSVMVEGVSGIFIDVMMATYANTRIGRQELDGELIADVEGSLWPRAMIEQCRRDMPGRFDRVVVGVDPPASAGEGADACGIVVCARIGEEYYVLADESVQGLSPERWARAVARAVAQWEADRVVAEANNGGAMVAEVLRIADSGLAPKLVHAARGKVARAEPVSLLFEAGRAFVAGRFPELEDELAGLQAGGAYEGPTRSPDRADAMVWAMSELAERRASVPRVRAL